MSYPMNEYVMDMNDHDNVTEDRIAEYYDTIDEVGQNPESKIHSEIKTGQYIYKYSIKQKAMKVIRNHTCLLALIGMGSGAILGYVITSKLRCK